MIAEKWQDYLSAEELKAYGALSTDKEHTYIHQESSHVETDRTIAATKTTRSGSIGLSRTGKVVHSALPRLSPDVSALATWSRVLDALEVLSELPAKCTACGRSLSTDSTASRWTLTRHDKSKRTFTRSYCIECLEIPDPPDLTEMTEVEQRLWLLRAEGKTHQHIADEIGFERSKVTRMFMKIDKRA